MTKKVYEVSATEVVSGYYYVEAESAAEAAFLIDSGFAEYEATDHTCGITYHIDDLTDEDGEAVYEYDEHNAFEKAYYAAREQLALQADLFEDEERYFRKRRLHEMALQEAREVCYG